MFKIALVIFREFLEIVFFLSLIFSVTRGLPFARYYINLGILFGVIISCLLAYFINFIVSAFSGIGQEFLECVLVFFTACMISWTIIWMKSRVMRIKNEIYAFSNSQSNRVVNVFYYFTISLTVSTAIIREGTEIILCIFSILTTEFMNKDYFIAVVMGIIAGVLVGVLVAIGIKKLFVQYLFTLSSAFLMLMGAALSAKSISILASIDLLTLPTNALWDTSWILDDNGFVGRTLHDLIGYTAKPSALEVLFYFSYIILTWILSHIYQKRIVLGRIG